MAIRQQLKPPEDQQITARIVQEIAALENVEPATLSPPMYDVVDPDALNALLSTGVSNRAKSELQVRFEYRNYEVVVSGKGDIEVLDNSE